MNIKVLRYFVATVNEPNLSKAAESTFTTQPNLSRQLAELEAELGQPLFDRSRRKLVLTPQGEFLYSRAKKIIEMFDRTQDEVRQFEGLSGKIIIAAGETPAFAIVAEALKRLREEAPKVTFEIISGNAFHTSELLKSGLANFGLFIGEADTLDFLTLDVGLTDEWGIVCRKESPIASHAFISPHDLKNVPLMGSAQAFRHHEFARWLGNEPLPQTIGYFNLPFNALIGVKQGLGCALTLKNVGCYETGEDLVFIPLKPKMEAKVFLAWPKGTQLDLSSKRFLQHFQDIVRQQEGA